MEPLADLAALRDAVQAPSANVVVIPASAIPSAAPLTLAPTP